ncbi:high affinity immunoglobulin gamma Fc receptor I-like isoform X4 [Aquarana catesbeiana]|uniref:high affinity immunoglobulin gamma Fc receptor I-like isoform X4 n=1 Tax=Aquarana catesbeiana TaxID=8400 RepID=UPI003CCA697E
MHVAVIMSLFLSSWVKAETTTRPMVSFTPEWNKIFTGEAITMTCDVRSMVQGVLVYTWYKDGHWLHTGKSYTIQQAQYSHSGNYQCQLGTSDRSDSARLDVDNSYLILQAPLHVYEGDNVTLRCTQFPGYAGKLTAFYKDDMVIQDWSLKSELLIENIDNTSNQRYKCTKQVQRHLLYYLHTAKVTFSAQELFTPPVLRVIEGDHTTLTCDTSLSPLRETTELHFSFYRDGQNVQSYSTASRFSIPSASMKDSGSYTCQVRTLTNEVEKTSMPLHVEAKRKETNNKNNLVSILPVTLVVLLLVLVVAILIFVYRRKQIWLSVNNQQQITGEKRLGGHHSSEETTDSPPQAEGEMLQTQPEEEEGDVIEIVTTTGDRDVVEEECHFTSESAQILIGELMGCNRDLETLKKNINDVCSKQNEEHHSCFRENIKHPEFPNLLQVDFFYYD